MSGIKRGFFTAYHSTATALCAFGVTTLWMAPPASHPVLAFLALLSMAFAGAVALLKALTHAGLIESDFRIACADLRRLAWLLTPMLLLPLVLILANLAGVFAQGRQPAQLCIGLALSYAWYVAFHIAARSIASSRDANARPDAGTAGAVPN